MHPLGASTPLQIAMAATAAVGVQSDKPPLTRHVPLSPLPRGNLGS